MLIYHDLENGRELFLKMRLELFNKGEGDHDKKQFLADPEVRAKFEAQKNEIIKILMCTDFFHGTGAKHYPEKYHGTSTEIKDALGASLPVVFCRKMKTWPTNTVPALSGGACC